MEEEENYYDMRKIVYDLTKYDRQFRTIWEDLIYNELISDVSVDRETAVSQMDAIIEHVTEQPYVNDLYMNALTIMREYLVTDTYNEDPVVPIIIARRQYMRTAATLQYTDVWNYYYPETQEELNKLKLPYDDFPVLASNRSRAFRRMITENDDQYVARLLNYANREENRYSIDDLIRVCANANGVAEQIQKNQFSTEHNLNAHKLMIGIHRIARTTNNSPYTAVLNSQVLSQSTLESIVYTTRLDTNIRPGLSMITKVNKRGVLYGPLYEYVIGTVLNRHIPQIPGFMYTYGYYDGLPPSLIGDTAALIGYRSNNTALVPNQYYNGFFQYLRTGVPLYWFIRNKDYVAQLGERTLTHSQTVLLIYFILMNNIAYMNNQNGFIHQDLHIGNVMVVFLPQQYIINLKVYNGEGFVNIPVYTNMYPYVIDYGFASVRMGGIDDERIYSRSISLPVPHYLEDATTDLHSLIFLLLASTNELVDEGIFSEAFVAEVYKLYTMIFTGEYRDIVYSRRHYNKILSDMKNLDKYVMPQDTTHAYKMLLSYNTNMVQLLGLAVGNVSPNIFTDIIPLNTDVNLSLASVYLLNMCRHALTSYYPSILEMIEMNRVLDQRINELRLPSDYWLQAAEYVAELYSGRREEIANSFVKNNTVIAKILGDDAYDSALILNSYAYRLKIKTILYEMSKYYNIVGPIMQEIDASLIERQNRIESIINRLTDDYNTFSAFYSTIDRSNLLQYAYGTYNGYMINRLEDVVIIPEQ